MNPFNVPEFLRVDYHEIKALPFKTDKTMNGFRVNMYITPSEYFETALGQYKMICTEILYRLWPYSKLLKSTYEALEVL